MTLSYQDVSPTEDAILLRFEHFILNLYKTQQKKRAKEILKMNNEIYVKYLKHNTSTFMFKETCLRAMLFKIFRLFDRL